MNNNTLEGQSQFGGSIIDNQIQYSLQNVQTPESDQLSYVANVEYVNNNGGGGGFLSLNEMNFEKPLTNNLSFVNSQYTLLANQPSQNNAVANKLYTDNLVQNEAIQRQQQDTVLQTNINEEQKQRIAEDTTLQSNINTLSSQVWKRYPLFNKQIGTYNAETIDSLIGTGTSQSLNQINDTNPLTAPLNLTIQPVYVGTPLINSQPTTKFYTDQLLISEATARTNADNELQQQIDALDPLIGRSLVQINNAQSSVGQILNLQGVDIRVDSEPINLSNPVSVQRLSDVLENYLPSTTKLNEITAPDQNVSIANQRITNLAQPVDNQDGATKLYVDQQIGTQASDQIKANTDPTSKRAITQASEFLQFQGTIKQTINETKMVSNIPICYSSYLPQTENFQLATHEDLSNFQGQLNTEVSDRIAGDQNLQDQVNVEKGRITDLSNNTYRKWITGANKDTTTFNVTQVEALFENGNNYLPIDLIQRFSPLSSYLDLRISGQPTYCQNPVEEDQIVPKIYVDNSILALKLNTASLSPNGSVGFNNQRITDMAPALNSKDAMNLEQTQQLVAEATGLSLSQINSNYPSTGQVLDLSLCTNVKVPQAQSNDEAVSLFQTYQLIDAVSRIRNSTNSSIVTANENGTVSIKTNGLNSSNLNISCINNNNYTIQASELTLSSGGYLTLNGAQRVQCTTPLLSNSLLDTGSIYQVFNKSQNDDRYYQKIPLNQITPPVLDVAMAGNTLSNIRDAVDNLEPTNLAQVTSLIANSGFKNKIQSQSSHAQVICNQPNDTISIKANNSAETLDISATGSDYTISNDTGKIIISAEELNVNGDSFRVVGNGGGSTIFLAGDLQSTSLDLDIPTQILTRQQNDLRYLVNGTTISQLPPPDSSVSFGNQLLRNLQNPIIGTDASTKAYIDNLLPNYVTNEALVAGWLSKSQASTTYRTEQQVDSQISNTLIPYSTSSQIASIYLTQSNASITYQTGSQVDTKISTALVPYLTQASAQSIYRPLSSPDNKIQSTDGNTQLLANTGSSGISIRANNNQIGSIFQAIGQTGFTPLVIQATDKLQFISNEGSFSFTSGSGDTTNGIYIASNTDNTSQFCWDQVIIGSGTNRQGLVLSSGHTAQNIAYNAISSNTTSNTQSLTITPETSLIASQGGNQLLMYGNSMASSFPIQNIFNKKTGLSATQSSALANEFLTKGLADTLYTGGGGSVQALIRDSSSNNSVQCNASNPGIVLSNLQNIITSIQLGSSTSTGVALSFQSSSGGLGGIVALPGDYYIDHSANQNGFKFKDNLNNTIAFLKTPARAISEGTKQIIFFDNVQISTSQLTADSNDLIQRGYADSRYVFKDTALQNLTAPSANLSLNNFLITNLASGTISSGNTSSINGGNVYDYIATLPSVITQQVYTVTVFGSTTNGFQFTAFTNTPQNNTVQIQRVKGSGAQMITSSVVTSQSQTLVADFATLQLQVANANIRVTQVVPYTTTAFTVPGQQNIASLTFSQQAINTTSTCIQLYKPVSNQGGAVFILYVYVDQF